MADKFMNISNDDSQNYPFCVHPLAKSQRQYTILLSVLYTSKALRVLLTTPPQFWFKGGVKIRFYKYSLEGLFNQVYNTQQKISKPKYYLIKFLEAVFTCNCTFLKLLTFAGYLSLFLWMKLRLCGLYCHCLCQINVLFFR